MLLLQFRRGWAIFIFLKEKTGEEIRCGCVPCDQVLTLGRFWSCSAEFRLDPFVPLFVDKGVRSLLLEEHVYVGEEFGVLGFDYRGVMQDAVDEECLASGKGDGKGVEKFRQNGIVVAPVDRLGWVQRRELHTSPSRNDRRAGRRGGRCCCFRCGNHGDGGVGQLCGGCTVVFCLCRLWSG